MMDYLRQTQTLNVYRDNQDDAAAAAAADGPTPTPPARSSARPEFRNMSWEATDDMENIPLEDIDPLDGGNGNGNSRSANNNSSNRRTVAMTDNDNNDNNDTSATTRAEAPITWKAMLTCAFAAFGGFFFGYDSGYIGGCLGMKYFIHTFQNLPYDTPKELFVISSRNAGLIVGILSAGTFLGSIIAGDLADRIGRRGTVLAGCTVFAVGVALQVASTTVPLLATGRLIAGFGVGFVSAIIILYMSEVAPRKLRGAIVSGYQFCITLGLLAAACVTYATQHRTDSGSYRIPIGLQLAPALILFVGLFCLPESPRYYVKKGNLAGAARSLARVRHQPEDSTYVQEELREIVDNLEYEMQLCPDTGYWDSWAACFKGSLWRPGSNLRRTILGTSLQMMQQWTGVNFIFYYSTIFLQSLGTVQNPFLMSLVFTAVNVCSTPVSFYTVEKFGRRSILIWGAVGMIICQIIIATVGTYQKDNPAAIKAVISVIAIYIFFFATSWGPGAWVLVGEIYPLPIRSRGVGLSTASNWLWNCIIAVITPYLMNKDKLNMGTYIFFVWFALCFLCLAYAYLLVPETKGLTLEQVDRMFEETIPRKSAKWKPSANGNKASDNQGA